MVLTLSLMEEIIHKIKDLDTLPSFEESKQLFDFFEEGYCNHFSIRYWKDFCQKEDIYQIYNIEFIRLLADELIHLNELSIVEICAGNGKLSHQLRKNGINIKATDDYSWQLSDTNLVERLSHIEALEKYQPSVVVASWLPYNTKIGFDVLDFPSVNYLIHIGEDFFGATGMTNKDYDNTLWDIISLVHIEKYCLARGDYKDKVMLEDKFYSSVRCFKRK